MKQSDDEVFQSGDRELHIETIDFLPLKHYKQHSFKEPKKSDQLVPWKFSALKPQHSTPKPTHYNYTKNISFEEEHCYTNEGTENDDEENYQESCFNEYYRNCEQSYRKKLSFGTSWIGRKQYFASTFIDPSKIDKHTIQYYSPKTPFSNEESSSCGGMSFDSEFQSGNLLCAYKVSELQYDLLLQNDINTKGNTQWFYFRITNPPKNKHIKLNIVNLRKPDSLFNYGLLPCIYSLEEDKRSRKGWHRGGKQVKYFKNGHPVQNSKRYYFTLSFSVSTVYDKDVLCIAHSYPYTSKDLSCYLDSITKIKYKNELVLRQTLVNTIGKNKIEVLTIQEGNKAKAKPIIFVMARQHPGETPSSFVCQGLIDYFLSKDKEAQYLRKNYDIRVIPMVNPDGVAAGNYRTNLSGVDLNRRWDGGNKNKNMHQSVYIKKYLSQISKNVEVAFILDLHAHSRKFYSFFYGNPSQSNPLETRIYPLLCSKLGPNLIRFQDSTFTTEEFKRNTARVQLGLSHKTPNVFTYEVSFFGYIGKDKQKKHFTVQDLRQLGQILGKSIYLHERGKEIFSTNPENKQIVLYKKCINELRNNKSLITLGDRQNSGSQSSPSECQLKENEEQRLEDNEEYLNNKSPAKVKIVKKIIKSQPTVKDVCKSSRQMQVLDIAQVYSAFPNNIIALIPSSYLNKLKKPTFASTFVQTDDSPIIKIYETCKKQDSTIAYPECSFHLTTSESNAQIQKVSPTLTRSSMLNRPKTTDFQQQNTEYMAVSLGSQRKNKQPRMSQQKSTTRKVVSSSKNSLKSQQRSAQTVLSFGRSNANTISNLKLRLDNESNILMSKNIDPSFATLQYKKGNYESKFYNKTLSKNIYEHIKCRRMNGS